MIYYRTNRVKDPEKHWRKYAPKGHEDDFAQWADRYRQKLKPIPSLDPEWIDRQIRSALRMRARRYWSILDGFLYKIRQRRACSAYIPQGQKDNREWSGLWAVNLLTQEVIDYALSHRDDPFCDA